jgi:hypothetical protein
MGRSEKKKTAAGGNRTVFRGTVQLLRLLFPEAESGGGIQSTPIESKM